MSEIGIGLMGFGRIGRNVFRILHQRDDLRVRAICDPAEPRALEYLLRFDTILGRFPSEVSIRDDALFAAGRRIRFLQARRPEEVTWRDLGVQVVIEATGRRPARSELEGHLEAGAALVVLCTPPKDPPDLTVVMGVNDGELSPHHRIVSNASCTAHCAAPVVKILHDAFGVERAFLTSVHAYTNQQRLADVPAEDKRRGRAAAENIIPQETNAAEMVMQLLPELAGRVTAMSLNVPVPNGSVVDLVCWHGELVDAEAINEVMRTAASTPRWRGILRYEDEPIVSSDIVRSAWSSIFDGQATMVLGNHVSKTLAWYDNGWGYANRVVELVQRWAALVEEPA